MQSYEWLLYANVAVWLGIGGYLFFIARTQKNLERRLQQVELLGSESHHDH